MSPFAFRTYPPAVDQVGPWDRIAVRLVDGTEVVIRPIQKCDVELERSFIVNLSPESRRFRFLDTMLTPSDALLVSLTSIEAATDAAYVALIELEGKEHAIGVARFSALPDGSDCEFAVTVANDWQRKGIGAMLMERLIEIARSRGIKKLHSSDAADNTSMSEFANHLHFTRGRDPEDSTHILYSVDLG